MEKTRIKKITEISLDNILIFLTKELYWINFIRNIKAKGKPIELEPYNNAQAIIFVKTSEITAPKGGKLNISVYYIGNDEYEFDYFSAEGCNKKEVQGLVNKLKKEIERNNVAGLSLNYHLG